MQRRSSTYSNFDYAKSVTALSVFLASLVLSGEIYPALGEYLLGAPTLSSPQPVAANVHGIGVRKTNSLEALPSKNWACSSGIIIVIVCVKRICLSRYLNTFSLNFSSFVY